MLICLTASHKNADFAVLEGLAAADSHVLPTTLAAHPGVDGAVVVATCNRFEAYIDVRSDDPVSASAVAREAATSALAAEAIGEAAALDAKAGADAVHHLFAVAAGLESVVVGEGEIAGQVRRALTAAQQARTTTAELERLFQRASETQRGIKNRTGLGEAGRSIVRLALDLSSDRVHDWARARVLLVGTGRFAAASLAALRERGATHIEVWSPSGRGAAFARKHGIPAVDARDAPLAVASADVIVTCTTAEHFVIDATLIASGRARLAATHAHPGIALTGVAFSGVGVGRAVRGADAAGLADAVPAGGPAPAAACPVDDVALRAALEAEGVPTAEPARTAPTASACDVASRASYEAHAVPSAAEPARTPEHPSPCPVDHVALRAALEAVGAAPGPATAGACPVPHAPSRDARPGCPVMMGADEAACPVEHGRARQLVIDMGLPRNVDPDVALVHGVELLDLETIRIHAPLEHLTATEDARALVAKAARRFERGSAERRVAPAVTALREHVQRSLDAELERVRRRGTEAEQAAAEQALRHFAGMLLHRPTVRARELAATGAHDAVLDAVTELFADDASA